MNTNRIQKLLFNEYSDFEDVVLLESPFTETSEDGRGLRQVQMGLTTTKLILATDIIKSYDNNGTSFAYCLEAGRIGIDPEIESLELVSLFPVEVVNLSVYHRKTRHTLKAHFCNDTILYFELSGSEKRNMFWNLWLERINFLSPDNDHSSVSSESCGGSTASTSTLYIVGSQLNVMEPGRAQLLCYYNHEPAVSFGKRISSFKSDTNLDHRNKQSFSKSTADTSSSFRSRQDLDYHKKKIMGKLEDYTRVCKSSASLYEKFLSDESLGVALESEFDVDVRNTWDSSSIYESLDFYELIESSIQLWESGLKKKKHLRRYAFSPKPHFLHGLGPWKLSKGDTYSVQVKRSVSLVNIQRQPSDKSLHVNVSKRQLTNTISCEALHVMPEQNHSFCMDSKILSPTSPVVFFWTTNYWYRPQSASAAYGELRNHLESLKKLQDKGNKTQKQVRRKVRGVRGRLRRSDDTKIVEAVDVGTEKMRKLSSTSCTIDSELEFCACGKTGGSSSMISHTKNSSRVKNTCSTQNDYFSTKKPNSPTCPVSFLRQILKLKQNFTMWDFPTQILAHQLTMIDRNLFLRVSVRELGALIVQQCSRNAPNISALVAFSHRISCLVTTEVLKEQTVHMRARSIARFVDIADVCLRWKNFQSTQSILYGLCSPPIYRLTKTWAYLRHHHSSTNRRMIEMCQQFRDARLPTSQLIFTDGAASPPFLPSVAHVMTLLLNRIEDYPDTLLRRHCSKATTRKQETLQALKAHNQRKVVPSSIRRIFSAFRFQRSESNLENNEKNERKIQDETQNCNSDSCESTSIESKLNGLIAPILDKFEVDSKLQQFESICFSLLHWQRAAMMYSFKGSDNAIEYLLKARYLEERENFQISLNKEKH
ncbi:uncharacterized protein LOC111055124 isoform X1 [Nilaparvata lugens]|uniref:uncharacterized protein LOC111055124 isoform X1 n=1 Tax=Nilaparvata lugens TaxID=108931 RepID=UPI00193CE657|nr:uncharacterized protein LOC111055124 isoform X1 [Nilaparvata lugens]